MMKLVVISPEGERRDELTVLAALFAAGLERYHVRKPHASRERLAAWLQQVPVAWRARLVLHQHHELVAEFALGGRHWRDDGSAPLDGGAARDAAAGFSSRSCHDLASLRAALGSYHALFFSPVFPSISKPGHVPRAPGIGEALGAVLHTRSPAERRTAVIALGGVTVDTAPRARALGFDGVAVLGAVWQAPDPVAAFAELRDLCAPSLGAARGRSAAGALPVPG